jgi:hypothetical protein
MEAKSPPEADRWLLALCMLLGVLALGAALQVNYGALHPKALAYLSIALLLCLVGVLAPSPARLAKLGELPLIILASLGLLFQLTQLLTTRPGIYLLPLERIAFAPYFLGLLLALLLACTLFWQPPWLVKVRLPFLLLAFLTIGVWMIRVSPNPHIDVFIFQKESVLALFSGQNPYAMTYPDIYYPLELYGPGLSVDGRLTFGFPYPPLSLLLAIPGQLLGGDYRYSQLAAMALSAWFMAKARPGPFGTALAALFLFTPRIFFVLEQGWTEPYIVMLLAAVIYFAIRRPAWLPVALGLFLAIKQYMVFGLPLAYLLLPQPLPPWKALRRFGLLTLGTALLVSLPLAIWDLPAFWKDVVVLQLWQPFRPDALSYLAWFAQGSAGARLPTALAFIAAFIALGLALWRAPRTPAGFAAGVALVYIAFFAFNKQAFCNYYFFVLGAMACAAAATRLSPAAAAPPAGEQLG